MGFFFACTTIMALRFRRLLFQVNTNYNGRYTTFLPALEQLPKQHYVGLRKPPWWWRLRRRDTGLRWEELESPPRRSVRLQSIFSGVIEGNFHSFAICLIFKFACLVVCTKNNNNDKNLKLVMSSSIIG